MGWGGGGGGGRGHIKIGMSQLILCSITCFIHCSATSLRYDSILRNPEIKKMTTSWVMPIFFAPFIVILFNLRPF